MRGGVGECGLMGCESATCRVTLSRRGSEDDYVALTCANRQHKLGVHPNIEIWE